MKSLLQWLQGKKTYIVAGAMVALAAVAFWFGYADGPAAMAIALAGLGFAGLRNGMTQHFVEQALQMEAEFKKTGKFTIPPESVRQLAQGVAAEMQRGGNGS